MQGSKNAGSTIYENTLDRMKIGRSKRIQLLKVVNTKAANGSNVNTTTKYTYYAEVVSGSGFRNYQNSQTQLGSSYRFKIRHNAALDVDSKYSIIYDGKQFTVTGITRDAERNFYWLIDAVAKGS